MMAKIIKKLILLSFLGAVLLGLFWAFKVYQLKEKFVHPDYEISKMEVSYIIKDNRPEHWVAIFDLNKAAYGAFVVSEDWSFFEHKGFDFQQIEQAFKDFLFHNERLRGASTISQQLIKNVFLSHERSFLRKGAEAYLTMVMEFFLTKHKILEHYLNIVEFGKGVYGISDASLHYFNKEAKDLTIKESAFLAMLLPNPQKYSQSFRDKELSHYASTTIKDILLKMKIAQYISPEDYEKELSQNYQWEKDFNLIGDEDDYYRLNQDTQEDSF